MVLAPASGPRCLRRRAAADRERPDDLPTAHRSADDRSARPAARRPRARDRHGLRLPAGDSHPPGCAGAHDRAASRRAGRGRGAVPPAGPAQHRDQGGRRGGRLARARSVRPHHRDRRSPRHPDAAHRAARPRWTPRHPRRGPDRSGAGHPAARTGREPHGAARGRRAVRAPDLAPRVHRRAMVVRRPADDLLGAHVSTQGGVARAPERGLAIGATAIQVFTKTPNQWREPALEDDQIAAFRAALAASGVRAVVAHDSYLINLASPDEALREKSVAAFTGELTRCRALGIPWVVSHPGNYIDDLAAGLERNADGHARCLAAVPGDVGVLIEGTAGSGTALGKTFEELAALRRALPAALRGRVAFCLDTAHLHAAGYEVATELGGVWDRFDRVIGLDLLKCLHLNDSKSAAGARVDRHQWIGEGTIGPRAFRQILGGPAPRPVVKIIETPKGGDPAYHDPPLPRPPRA